MKKVHYIILLLFFLLIISFLLPYFIEFFYAELNVVMFEDIAKRDAGGYLSSEIDIIIGECKFSETKLEIKVTKSNINEIESGDEIILYRED